MKFKYYLKGVGCGILVATIILSISFFLNDNSMSREEIIQEAKKMGMVWPGAVEESEKGPFGNATESESQSETQNNSETQSESESESESQTESESESESESQTAPGTMITLTIEAGEYTRAVSEKLLALGLIDDAEAFRIYVGEKNRGQNIIVGTFQIPMGATFDEIIEIITFD